VLYDAEAGIESKGEQADVNPLPACSVGIDGSAETESDAIGMGDRSEHASDGVSKVTIIPDMMI
jgi:hypothetical protein